jgi:hypothetical protein
MLREGMLRGQPMHPVLRHLRSDRARYGPSGDQSAGTFILSALFDEKKVRELSHQVFSSDEFSLRVDHTKADELDLIRKTVQVYLDKIMRRFNCQDFMIGWIRGLPRILSFERTLIQFDAADQIVVKFENFKETNLSGCSRSESGILCCDHSPPFSILGFRSEDQKPHIVVAADAGFRELTVKCLYLMFDLLQIQASESRLKPAGASGHPARQDLNFYLSEFLGVGPAARPQAVNIEYLGESLRGFVR